MSSIPIQALQAYLRILDHETAQSAVRNLNNVDCGGRPLRIDLADSDPFLEGKTTMRGELIDNASGMNFFTFLLLFPIPFPLQDGENVNVMALLIEIAILAMALVPEAPIIQEETAAVVAAIIGLPICREAHLYPLESTVWMPFRKL